MNVGILKRIETALCPKKAGVGGLGERLAHQQSRIKSEECAVSVVSIKPKGKGKMSNHMKIKYNFFGCLQCHPLNAVCIALASMLFESIVASAQTTNQFLYTGSETNITLPPGSYDITAFGAQGGQGYTVYFYGGGGVFTGGASSGAEVKAEFNFTTPTTLTLLVGAAGTNGGADFYDSGGGGGGGSFVVTGSTPLLIAGGGGGAGGGNGGAAGGNNGNVGAAGGAGSGSYPNYGGTGGTGGTGGAYPAGPSGGSDPSGLSGGGGGGGYSGDGGSGGGDLGGYGGSSFLDGGAGGAGDDSVFGGYGGYGGGGGGGLPNGANGGFGGGGGGGYSGGGGGSGLDPYYIGAGGGGGSVIDSSAVAILTEVSGVASPDDSPNGEIIITAVPEPTPITITSAATAGAQFGFNIAGPTNATIVVEACTNLVNMVWIPVATNILSNGTNYFTDAQWANYPYRFYRISEP
jgi:hypothetical protein